MKPRNPVISNSWRYNKPSVIPSKKKEFEQKRYKRVFDLFMEY